MHVEALQIQQMEFPLLQLGEVISCHQQLLVHQPFGGCAVVDAFKAHHK